MKKTAEHIKDLTEYYKNKYPEADVKTVVVSYIFGIKYNL